MNHDDADREFAYTAGAEPAIQRAAAAWPVVSMAQDRRMVFASPS